MKTLIYFTGHFFLLLVLADVNQWRYQKIRNTKQKEKVREEDDEEEKKKQELVIRQGDKG